MSKDMKFIDNIVSESKGIPRAEEPKKKKSFSIFNLFNKKNKKKKIKPPKGLFNDF